MKAEYKIYGPIAQPDIFAQMFGVEDNCTSSKHISDFLDANKEADEIVIRINSEGGDVQEGWNIYDLLTTSGKKITTVGEGKIYSIATVVFLAGEERRILKNADGLIHNPWTGYASGNSSDLARYAEELAQEEEKILNIYVEKTGQDRATLANYMKDETKLSSEDMLSLGFATSIIEPIKAFAYINFNNQNQKMDETFLNKITAAIDAAVTKIQGFSRLPAKNQDLTDADGNTFKLEKETGAPVVGDAASPDGTYKMEDGKAIIVSGGVITEITEGDEDEMAKAQKRIAGLEAENEALKASALEIETIRAKLETETLQAQALVNDLKALKNEWVPEGRKNGTGSVDGFSVEKVKEIMDKIKNK